MPLRRRPLRRCGPVAFVVTVLVPSTMLVACQPVPKVPGPVGTATTTTTGAPSATTTTTTTPVPQLPRSAAPLAAGTLLFDSDRSGHFELYTRDPAGVVTRLTTTTTSDSWWARLSPDRRTVVFQRTPAGVHDLDYDQVELWAVAASGGSAVRLRAAHDDGWDHQGHVDWSPDGAHLVLFGGTRYDTQIFETDALGRQPRRVTDRPGTNLDPTYAPDGTHIAFVGCPAATCYPADYEVYVIPRQGGTAVRLTTDHRVDHDPYLAPDGTRVAWLTQIAAGPPEVWDVMAANADGTGAHRLFGDDGNAGAPVWSGSAAVLVHRFPAGHTAFALFRVPIGGGAGENLSGLPTYTDEYPSPGF